MEDLSFVHRLDHEPATSFDDTAAARTERRARRSVSNSPPAYRSAALLDGLSAYAAVFDCSSGCTAVHA